MAWATIEVDARSVAALAVCHALYLVSSLTVEGYVLVAQPAEKDHSEFAAEFSASLFQEIVLFEVLHLLLANAGRVLTRETLIDRVWGTDYVGDTKTLDVHIKRLRSKIEADPSAPTRIVTIRGLGYKYERTAADRPHERLG